MEDGVKAQSEPIVKMSAVKLDRDGNVVEEISFENVRVEATPGFFQGLKDSMKEGWEEGKRKGENV